MTSLKLNPDEVFKARNKEEDRPEDEPIEPNEPPAE